jgi:hypothetical protein
MGAPVPDMQSCLSIYDPDPATVTFCGDPPPVSLNTTVACRAPVAEGTNVTKIWQEAPVQGQYALDRIAKDADDASARNELRDTLLGLRRGKVGRGHLTHAMSVNASRIVCAIPI